MDPPLTLSHIQKLTQLTVLTPLQCDYDLCIDSLIPSIVSLVATSPSLKRLILLVLVIPWRFRVTAVPDFCGPLVSLVSHCSLEHIELQFKLSLRGEKVSQMIQEVVRDMPEVLRVPELKELYSSGFLSVTGPEGLDEWTDL